MHSVVWWEIDSADPAGSRRFYGELFGWTFSPAFEEHLDRPYWLVQHHGKGIGGLQQAVPGAPPPQGISLGLWTSTPTRS